VQRAGHFRCAGGEAVQFFERNFSVIERAEHQPAAVRAEVASKIMSGHKEIRPQFKASAGGVKMFSEFDEAVGKRPISKP
jgi:hypothetical protein